MRMPFSAKERLISYVLLGIIFITGYYIAFNAFNAEITDALIIKSFSS